MSTPHETAAEVARRSGMIEPVCHAHDDLTCPPGGSVTWCVQVQDALWARSIELPADMDVEEVTIAGLPVVVAPEYGTHGTHLVDDGPPEYDGSPIDGLEVVLSPRARAYKVTALPAATSRSLIVDLDGHPAMRVVSPGQSIAITFTHRMGEARRFQARLHGDAIDPAVHAQLNAHHAARTARAN